MWISLGITGLSGSGKDTFANLIEEFARAYGIQVFCKKLSDEVRKELYQRGLSSDAITRIQLIETGNELRATYGGGILAKRTITEYNRIIEAKQNKPLLVMITGIRNPKEVETFRDEWKEKFILVSIEADQQCRNERMIARNQYLEDLHPSQEIEKADEDIGIHDCQRIADYHVVNNGSEEELSKKVTGFLDICISPILNKLS